MLLICWTGAALRNLDPDRGSFFLVCTHTYLQLFKVLLKYFLQYLVVFYRINRVAVQVRTTAEPCRPAGRRGCRRCAPPAPGEAAGSTGTACRWCRGTPGDTEDTHEDVRTLLCTRATGCMETYSRVSPLEPHSCQRRWGGEKTRFSHGLVSSSVSALQVLKVVSGGPDVQYADGLRKCV